MADAVQDKLDPKIAKKFAVDRLYSHVDLSRSGAASELPVDELCTAEDLLV